MQLVANTTNGILFSSILPSAEVAPDIDFVKAAVAYGSAITNPKGGLVQSCVDNSLKMDLWMRYDHTVPVSIPLLNVLLEAQSSNVFTNFVPDVLHSKVVWWKGYGAYIGSANHSERAWNTNIELGVFIIDDELVANRILSLIHI